MSSAAVTSGAIVLGDLADGAPEVIDRMTGSPPAIDMMVYAGA